MTTRTSFVLSVKYPERNEFVARRTAKSLDTLEEKADRDFCVTPQDWITIGGFSNTLSVVSPYGSILKIEQVTDIPPIVVDADDNGVTIYGRGQQIVAWTTDEWIEDPSVTISIANAIRVGYECGADMLAHTIRLEWKGTNWTVIPENRYMPIAVD